MANLIDSVIDLINVATLTHKKGAAVHSMQKYCNSIIHNLIKSIDYNLKEVTLLQFMVLMKSTHE